MQLPDTLTGVTIEAEFNDDGTASILVEIREDGQEPRRVEGVVSAKMLGFAMGMADRIMPGVLSEVERVADEVPGGVVVIPQDAEELGT